MTTNDAITTQLVDALRKAQAALDSVAQPRSLQAEALADVDDALVAYDALTSQPSGEAVSIPVVQQTAPERIWLAVADDAYYADKPFPDGEEVCWSSDAPLQVCVPYVRADLATHPRP